MTAVPTSSPAEPRRSSGRFWLILILLLIGGVGAAFWPGQGRAVQVDIPEGATGRSVARIFLDTRVIQSRYPLLGWIRVRNAASKIHAGRYLLSPGRSAFWLVDDLIQGRTEKVRVVIPEGWAAWQIAERLEAEGVCSAKPFMDFVRSKNLEGYLFPATYDFEVALSPATAASRMNARFEKVWSADMDQRARDVGMTRAQVMTLASIVEREVRVHDEAPTIAAVYLNRLHINMHLDADPTVQYALGGWKTRLTYADYRNTDSPYNTYRVSGLPPGPICNPGVNSIKAALWPAPTDALYFVAADDGHHSFSSSYREHTNKVNKRNRQRRLKAQG